MKKKLHIPSVNAVGRKGFSLCGIMADYLTGDHQLIRQLAREAKHLKHDHYCNRCQIVLSMQDATVAK
jgi:hypothetical protein